MAVDLILGSHQGAVRILSRLYLAYVFAGGIVSSVALAAVKT